MKTAPQQQTVTRFVHSFDEAIHGGRELLGGKGLGLSEMAHLDVPVPAGFTITTDACRAYMATGGELPPGLEDEIEEHIAPARARDRLGLRQSLQPAARLGPLRRRDLDAGDDGHDPRPRAQRRDRARLGRRDGERPLRLRLVPPADPDVRRGRRGHRRPPLRAGAGRSSRPNAASTRTSSWPRPTC